MCLRTILSSARKQHQGTSMSCGSIGSSRHARTLMLLLWAAGVLLAVGLYYVLTYNFELRSEAASGYEHVMRFHRKFTTCSYPDAASVGRRSALGGGPVLCAYVQF